MSRPKYNKVFKNIYMLFTRKLFTFFNTYIFMASEIYFTILRTEESSGFNELKTF